MLLIHAKDLVETAFVSQLIQSIIALTHNLHFAPLTFLLSALRFGASLLSLDNGAGIAPRDPLSATSRLLRNPHTERLTTY